MHLYGKVKRTVASIKTMFSASNCSDNLSRGRKYNFLGATVEIKHKREEAYFFKLLKLKKLPSKSKLKL